MLLVFYGNNRQSIRVAVDDYLKNNLPQNANLTTIEADNYQLSQLSEAINTNSLFGGEQWFIIDNPQENKDLATEIKTVCKDLATSTNTFLVMEGELLAVIKKQYKQHAQAIQEFKTPIVKNRFNVFLLTDSLIKKDKRKLWIDYQLARHSGISTEEIVGILWWQLKLLRLAQITDNANEAGVSSYPYQKSKKNLIKFKTDELAEKIVSLVEVYHKGRAEAESELLLEKWILEL